MNVRVGSAMVNNAKHRGNWTAMVAIAPVHPLWARWLPGYWKSVEFSTTRLRYFFPPLLALIKLSMIAFARWSVVRQVPADPGEGEVKRLPKPYLLFESNYNTGVDQYLEAFSLIVLWGMRFNFQGTYGIGNIRKVSAFQRFVKTTESDVAWYYSAYPNATAKTIRSALELERRHSLFTRDADDLSDEEFKRGYHKLLSSSQPIRNPRPKHLANRDEQTNGLTLMAPIEDGHSDLLTADLASLDADPLPVPRDRTHFARYAIARHLLCPPKRPVDPTSYLFFSAWFDGDPAAFAERLYECLDERAARIWRHCGYTGTDRGAFCKYVCGHTVAQGSGFPGFDGVTVTRAQEALELRRDFIGFALLPHDRSPADLRADWHRLLKRPPSAP